MNEARESTIDVTMQDDFVSHRQNVLLLEAKGQLAGDLSTNRSRMLPERQQHAWYTESASAMLLLMPPELSIISQNSSLYHPICTSVYAKASTPTFFTVQFHYLELYKPGRYGELSRHLRGTNDVL